MSRFPQKKNGVDRRRDYARAQMRQTLRGWRYVRLLREIAAQCDDVEPERVPALRLKADIYRGLLAKVLPDLRAIEVSGHVEHRHVEDLTDAELTEYLGPRSSEGTAETPAGPPEPAAVH